ncbi:hypothetical protein RDV77_09390 [Porphyromonadaceae sp. NP-X]|jgi:hypothetical protein|nr:hypothetical protein [Porphyromonadaceae sp. NP-X]NMC98873.1 hypothetical protein [Bacteroidales bacterium]
MYKLQIYCELDFLHKFFSDKPDFKIDDSTKFEKWNNYLKLFLKDCSLILNNKQKYEKFVAEKNELFLILNKRCDGGEINIEFNENVSDTIQNEKIDQLFFLTDTNTCKKLEDDYGMFFISNETLEDKANILFIQSTIPIEKKESQYKDWNFLEKYAQPCNAMIIADNYILKNENDIRFNLIILLDKLLPKKLNKIDFVLTIITGDGKSVVDLKSRYELIRSELQKLERPYKINIKIIGKSEYNHDRNLITNYLHINSGFGFTLFRKKDFSKNAKNTVLANTTVSINSIVGNNEEKEVVESLKKQYEKINSESRNIGYEKIVYPEQKIVNRLIESTLKSR